MGPDFGTAVLEELQELGDEHVERPVEGVRVQHLGGVLTHLLQRPERALAHSVLLRVEHLTQAGKEVGPRGQLTLRER